MCGFGGKTRCSGRCVYVSNIYDLHSICVVLYSIYVVYVYIVYYIFIIVYDM